MMNQEQFAVRERAIALMKSALSTCPDGIMEAQVHQAVDLLRFSQADNELLDTAQFVSCGLMQMRNYRREGRVNAYASKLVRVRKACESLS